ncbi:MAG: methyltransferase domain-containing protein [Thermoleophilia bacterium]
MRAPFADGAFDLYVSNAVVEHVGAEAAQRRFVHEAVRVAGSVFLTTPNRWFPLEVHTRLPLVHWLPPAAAGRAYDLAGKGWAREVRPLGPAALRRLFPPRTDVRIVNLGLTLVALAGDRVRR